MRGAPGARRMARRPGRWWKQGTWMIAHVINNVNFPAKNVNGLCPENRSETACRRAETALVGHTLGDRFSCKRYRKSCNAYSDRPMAYPLVGRRGRFAGLWGRIFNRFNQKPADALDFLLYCQKQVRHACVICARGDGRWISRALSRLTGVKSDIAHMFFLLLHTLFIRHRAAAGIRRRLSLAGIGRKR